MSFIYKGNINGGHNRTFMKVLLANSLDWRVGDVVSVSTSDTVIACSPGLRVLGVIAAIITDAGVVPSSNGCGGAYINTYKTASDNATVGKVAALVDVDPNSLYSVDLDDTIGTTTGSNRKFYFIDIDTGLVGRKLDESTASTGNGQFLIVGANGNSGGLDPDNSNRVIVKIVESILHKSDTA